MAFIYRYQLFYKAVREASNLTEFKNEIGKIISSYFGDNLKETPRVELQYFEFKLYESVDNLTLQNMGRELLRVSVECFKNIPRNPWQKFRGFIRKPQKLYAIVYPADSAESPESYLEFLDAEDFDDEKRLLTQAEEYVNAHTQKNDIAPYESQDNTTKILFYADIFSATTNSPIFLKNASASEQPQVYKLTCRHRKIDRWADLFEKNEHEKSLYFELDDVPEIELIGKRFIEKGEDTYDEEIYRDILHFKIEDFTSVTEDKRIKLLEMAKIKISEIKDVTEIPALNKVSATNKLKFTVHNVGQGLMTSFAQNTSPPFLYFDFGMGYGQNKFNALKAMSGEVDKHTTIILSHNHRDHWYALSEKVDAFKCHWIISNQEIRYQFGKKLAEILVSCGIVNKITRDVAFPSGVLFSGAKYAGTPKSDLSHEHITGLSLKIKLYDSKTGADTDVFIAGDQRYDCMDISILSDIDILVASHHGGAALPRGKNNPYPTPKISPDSMIVYSYGDNNSHGHPSRTSYYLASGWSKRHDTHPDDDFIRWFG